MWFLLSAAFSVAYMVVALILLAASADHHSRCTDSADEFEMCIVNMRRWTGLTLFQPAGLLPAGLQFMLLALVCVKCTYSNAFHLMMAEQARQWNGENSWNGRQRSQIIFAFDKAPTHVLHSRPDAAFGYTR